MTFRMNRHIFCRHSLIGVGIYWVEIILGTGYVDSDLISREDIATIGIFFAVVITCFWLVSIWLAKRDWLWISAIFSWFLFGIAAGGPKGWTHLSEYGASDTLVGVGILLSFFQIYIVLLGLAMPILRASNLLAPEPQPPAKPET